jgi:hypothetical protein
VSPAGAASLSASDEDNDDSTEAAMAATDAAALPALEMAVG